MTMRKKGLRHYHNDRQNTAIKVQALSPALLIFMTGGAFADTAGPPMDFGALDQERWYGIDIDSNNPAGSTGSTGAGMSSDGSIIVGWGSDDPGKPFDDRAIVWSGSTKIDLGTLRSDNSGRSRAYAASADGTIIVGSSNSDLSSSKMDNRATVWSGDNWSMKKDLGTLKSDNSGMSFATATSADGSVIVGHAETDSKGNHATVWSGDDWSTKTDLGTLKNDNSGHSTANAVSADGTVVTGQAETDAGAYHATVWKLKYTTPPTPIDPIDPPTVITIDVTNTNRAVSELGRDTFSVMELQRLALLRLQQGCDAGYQQACWSVGSGLTVEGGNSDTAANFTMGYGVAENLSVGFTLENSLDRSLPDTFSDEGGNIGAGIYARWYSPFSNGEWYLKPALAFNEYNVSMQRTVYSHTEAGKGGDRMTGYAASLEGGQKFTLKDELRLGWYGGLRYSNVQRDGYTENDIEFAVKYEDVDYRSTAVYAGIDVDVPVSNTVRWVSSVEVEQELSNNDPQFRASQQYMGGIVTSADMAMTRGAVRTGVVVELTKGVNLQIMTGAAYTALGDPAWGAGVRLGGAF
ncbi:TPA: autotransporter domain-containing protein [Salmonella enterica]|uniref:Autotransporter domain-containing protein n=1 Tax=Salmonella enterica TaxID=28901 RepID=A0A749BWV7_SALER|nr:autotransporter domain-containing protein [Salmonella enterica]